MLLALVLGSGAALFMAELQIGKLATMHTGGSPRAWLVLLGLFQLTLLAGYLAAWWLQVQSRFRQRLAHAVLGLCMLGFVWWSSIGLFPMSYGPESVRAPVRWVLLQYLSGPLWMILGCALTVTLAQSRVTPAARPALYGASNLGAFLGLCAYPLIFEPWVGLSRSALVLALAASLVLLGQGLLLRREALWPPVSTGPGRTGRRGLATIVLWAALGSAFLTVATAWATLDLSSIPLIWALLLAAYLLSWVIAFGPLGRLPRQQWDCFAGLSLIGMLAVPGTGLLSAFACAIAVCCLCTALHLRLLPAYQGLAHAPANVAIALGGAAGGLLTAILPPLVFAGPWEWELLLALLVLALGWGWLAQLLRSARPSYQGLINQGLLLVALLIAIGHARWVAPGPWTVIAQVRDLHGVWTVSVAADRSRDFRLVSGSTYHGSWGEEASWSYYSPEGPLGAGIAALRHQRSPGLEVLAVGLGAGTFLEYFFAEDRVLTVDISPALLALHRGDPPLIPNLARAEAQMEVRLADGRQVLEEPHPQPFHLIKLDAFTSGSIPSHLLTTEALARAWQLLREDGLLMIHVSNQHVAVPALVMNAARHLGLSAALLVDEPQDGDDIRATESTWVLIGNEATLTHPRIIRLARAHTGLGHLAAWQPVPEHQDRRRPWSDDRSGIIPYLLW
ncbi:MAG: hypothetical protein EA402_04135 [Planctomycetota bacterium]|nr:MAG: hypothetical protein EA402_04135 [Planctomycetota bacterium]